ncbi:HNH endonuclease [Terracoccus luteus]|uniref:HNH endonuclease n=1 Tax=Terracoccus luteus TaxID=53356 RepID=UPI001FE46AAB|nr:HNH endonuclease [Terracoccus luteus]
MATTWGAELDRKLRDEAMRWLAARTNDGADSIRSEALREFRFRGEPFALMDMQRGIRKPAVLDAALSFRTVYRPDGAERPYDDGVGLADGLIRYKYRGEDPQHPENAGLRAAMARRLPLIWFFGVGPGVYLPTFPVFVVKEERHELQFVVDAVTHGDIDLASGLERNLKRYITVETRRRLHQPIFRATVIRAYGTRCAVCALGHTRLLDAAHIVPDRDERGVAEVRNGLALCKIHHAALDAHILGVRPDLVVEIRQDLLEEVDGPMLRHGLQDRHRQKLMVLPARRDERPDPGLLEIAYDAFRASA